MKARILYLMMFFLAAVGARAQDPAIAGINPTLSPLKVGQITTIEADLVNGSSDPILQANNVNWTISLPPNVEVQSITFDVPSISSFLSIYQSPYDPTGTIIEIVSDKGNFPGNGIFVAIITVKGVKITTPAGFAAPMTIQATTVPPVGTNDPGNDNTNSSIVVIPATPIAMDDVSAALPTIPTVISLFPNDTPGANAIAPATPDAALIVPGSVKLIDPATNLPATSVTIPGEGTYQVNPDGTVTFTSIPGFTGAATPIQYTFDDSYGQTSNPALISVTVGPLPVTLVTFNVAREGKTAHLTWATTEESNSDRFEIEHSLNGKEWAMIGKLSSHGESKVLQDYFFDDRQPANGNNLYRLKMVDFDKTYAYSRIQSVKFDGIGGDLSIYPNPVADQLFIRDFSQVTSVVINDLNGRAVHQSGATTTGAINVQNLSAGMYLVRISRSNGVTSTQKIVVGR